MPATPIAQQENLVGFMLGNFQKAYDQEAVAESETLGLIMDEWPSERRTETYGYNETSPYMKRWARDQDREMDAFKSVKWTTEAVDWSVGVQWHDNDAQDNQLHDTETKASEAGANTKALDIEVTSKQLLEGGTDLDLLESIPTAPDGAAIFATTANGAARFGVTDGNSLTGTGVTASAIEDDIFRVLQQFAAMKNTKNKPLWAQRIIEQGLLLIYPTGLMKAMAQALERITGYDVIENQAGTENVATGTKSNVFKDAGIKIKAWRNPWLSDANDWYAYLMGSARKPFYKQVRQPLRHHVQDFSNSDDTRKRKTRGVMWDARYGYGVGPVYSLMKVGNS